MNKRVRTPQDGIAHPVGLVLIILVLAVVGFAFIRVMQANKESSESSDSSGSTAQNKGQQFYFERLPFDVKDIGSVAPVGEFAGITRQTAPNSHYTGNYRHYVFSKKPGEYAYNVYAPADGEIVAFRNSEMTQQYRFNFKMPGNAFYYLDHIQSLSADLTKKLEAEFGSPLRYTQAVEGLRNPIKVKAGDVLGQTGLKGIAWDWGVIDPDKCEDVLKPEHYHSDMCPQSVYDYLTDDLKAQIAPLAGYWTAPPGGSGLLPVKTTPLLGKYGHDKKGTLSGAWFQQPKSWQNAFFYPDVYKPDALQIRLAIPELSIFGVWTGVSISSTAPNPAEVTPSAGIVAYVLPKVNARDHSDSGVLLVRVNQDESITLEALAGTTTPPANLQFSSKAVTIKR